MTEKPRTTKKPIPDTPLEWIKEVEGVRGYLMAIKNNLVQRPPQWLEGNRKYYADRFKDLINHPPEGIRVRGNQYTRIWKP